MDKRLEPTSRDAHPTKTRTDLLQWILKNEATRKLSNRVKPSVRKVNSSME